MEHLVSRLAEEKARLDKENEALLERYEDVVHEMESVDTLLNAEREMGDAYMLHIIIYVCWRLAWLANAGREKHARHVSVDALVGVGFAARAWEDLTHRPPVARDLIRVFIIERLCLQLGLIRIRADGAQPGARLAFMRGPYARAIEEALSTLPDPLGTADLLPVLGGLPFVEIKRINVPDRRCKYDLAGNEEGRARPMMRFWFHPLLVRAHVAWLSGGPDPLDPTKGAFL